MTHSTATAFLTIDVAAIVANWRRIQAEIGPTVETAGVVKADCYGLGARAIVPSLAAAGCRTFFVATIDEAIAVRGLAPQGTIFVLGGPLEGTAGEFTAHGLTPVLNTPGQIARWSEHARAQGRRLPAALHLDTGMSRLGLDAAQVETIRLDGIDPVVVMSHMACADEPDHEKNPDQLSRFKTLAVRLALPGRLSLGASSTIFLGSDYHFDLVRPGAALYGLNPVPGKANPMAGVARLQARILQVRDVDTPMTVGYGATHRFSGKGRVAVAALGYADGLFRSASNRAFGVIEGERVPVVGRVSMDLTTFDVSALPEGKVREGTLVELFGPSQSVDDLAEQAGTIGYEILTALGARYHRVYDGGVA